MDVMRERRTAQIKAQISKKVGFAPFSRSSDGIHLLMHDSNVNLDMCQFRGIRPLKPDHSVTQSPITQVDDSDVNLGMTQYSGLRPFEPRLPRAVDPLWTVGASEEAKPRQQRAVR